MPIDAVELNDITRIGGDPELSYGTDGGTNAVIPFNQGIQFLSSAARLQAEADQFKYLKFQDNLANFYKQWDDVKVDGLMEKDYPAVTEEYQQLARDIADNYQVLRNPNIDPEKFAQLKEREAKLRGTISRSKQDVAFRDAHQKWFQQNPTMNTPENQAKLDRFNTAALGERQPFTVTPSLKFNPSAVAKAAMETALSEIKTEKDSGRYIDIVNEKTYLKDKYLAAAKSLLSEQDNSGRPLADAAMESFTKLKWLNDPSQFDAVYEKTMLDLLNQDTRFSTLREDPVSQQEDQQKFLSGEGAKERASRERIAALKGDEKEIEKSGRDYNEALTSGFTTGYVRPELLQNLFGDNSEIETTERTGGGQDPVTLLQVPVTEKKTKVAKVTAISSRLDSSGNLLVKRRNNETGVEDEVTMNYSQAVEAFKNLQGTKNAGRVADAAEAYRVKNKLGVNPTLPVLQKHFQTSGNADANLTDYEYFQKYGVARPKPAGAQ